MVRERRRHRRSGCVTEHRRREVWFAKVTGAYQHSQQPPIEGYFHWRTVEWLGTADRDIAIPHDRLRDIDQQPTIYELDGVEYWSGLATTSPLTNGPAAIKARKARRTSTTGTKPAVVQALCASTCGFQ